MKSLGIVAIVSIFMSAPVFAGGLERFHLNDAAFARIVNTAVSAYETTDALRATPECAVLDYKYFRKHSLMEAIEVLDPCLNGASERLGFSIKAEPGVIMPATEASGPIMGIVIKTGKVPVTAQSFRDLNHSLQARNWELLGHRVRVAREGDVADRASAIQRAIDGCMLPTVLRKIESGKDFIAHYGACVAKDKTLKVKELRQSPGHQFGVIAVSAGSDVVIQSINGAVSVNAESGPVRILVIAYPETPSLP